MRRLLGLDRLGDRGRGRRPGPTPAAVGLEQDRPLDPDRHRVAELLLGRGRPERQDGRRPALRLDDPDGLLDAALLVRADREPQEARVDGLAVGGQHDPAAGLGHALDADEDVHGVRRPDPGVVGVEQRRRAGDGDGHRVALAEVLDEELRPPTAYSGGR